MFNIQKKETLARKERRLLEKFKKTSSIYYSYLLYPFLFIFSPIKYFLIISKKTSIKFKWVISVSLYKIFWIRLWYIDDFVVHKKIRWKWVWKNLFNSAINNLKEKKCNYALLASHIKRKKSHNIYKKFWFTIINLWLFVLAYKKLKKIRETKNNK